LVLAIDFLKKALPASACLQAARQLLFGVHIGCALDRALRCAMIRPCRRLSAGVWIWQIHPALRRFENNGDVRSLWALSAALVDVFIEAHRPHASKEIILDFEAADDEVHGRQEGRSFHGMIITVLAAVCFFAATICLPRIFVLDSVVNRYSPQGNTPYLYSRQKGGSVFRSGPLF
jgi:hypothetical protein